MYINQLSTIGVVILISLPFPSIPSSPTKGGVFSGVSSKVTGWLGNASIPSMPAMPSMPTVSMPAMPAMPSIPSIPGLRKGGQTDENGGVTNEGLVTSPEKTNQGIAGATDAADEEDRSRYIR